jgi:hypothetical protein
MQPLARPLLITIGVVSLVIGTVGIFIPVLPTTPFLLLSAACFARSSERLHQWLIGHDRLGPYIAGFLYGDAIPRKAKRAALLTLWPGIAASCALIIGLAESAPVRLIVPATLVLIASAVSVYIISRPEED